MKPSLPFFLTLALSSTTLATPLWAQQEAPPVAEPAGQEASPVSEAAKQAAQSLFDEAVADYMGKRYDQASLKFRKAYAQLPEATFLYNLAKSLQKLENYDQAIKSLESAQAQQERPLPPNLQEKVPAFMAELKEQLEAQQAEQQAQQALSETTAMEATPEEGGRGLGALGWTGVGMTVVGAGAITWSILMTSDLDKEKEALEQIRTRQEFDAQKQEVEDDQNLARLLMFSGIGVAAVGVGLLTWDLVKDDDTQAEDTGADPTLSLTLVPHPTQGWAGLMGRW